MPPTTTPEPPAAPKARKGKAGKSAPTPTPPAPANGRPAQPAAKARAETAAQPGAGRRAAIRSAAMLLKQVSDATRLEVLTILAEAPIHVGALCERLGNQSQPSVSHHLALLRHSRLISPRRDGKFNFYEVTAEGRRLVECVRGLVDGEEG